MTDALPQPLTASAQRWYRLFRVPVVGLLKLGFRIEVIGADNVPETGPFILTPGAHQSIADTPAVAAVTTRMLRFLGAEKFFAVPVFGRWLTMVGGFPVERDATDRQALRVAEAILESGQPLVVFPEATRASGPEVQPIKPGAAFLACRTGSPIVPVGLGGGARALPKGSYVPRPTKLVLVVGQPIVPPVAPDGGRVPRREVSALTDRLQTELQALFVQAQMAAGVEMDEPVPTLEGNEDV